jgi:hypothetical protein
MRKDDYWYLATEYSKYPEGLDEAYNMALYHMSILMKAGVNVYCPIVHNHEVSKTGLPTDHDYWMAVDLPMLKHAYGCIVVKTPTWETSSGIRHEIDYCKKHARIVIYMEPGKVPSQFTEPGELCAVY